LFSEKIPQWRQGGGRVSEAEQQQAATKMFKKHGIAFVDPDEYNYVNLKFKEGF